VGRASLQRVARPPRDFEGALMAIEGTAQRAAEGGCFSAEARRASAHSATL